MLKHSVDRFLGQKIPLTSAHSESSRNSTHSKAGIYNGARRHEMLHIELLLWKSHILIMQLGVLGQRGWFLLIFGKEQIQG